jgi:hypothetical protein
MFFAHELKDSQESRLIARHMHFARSEAEVIFDETTLVNASYCCSADNSDNRYLIDSSHEETERSTLILINLPTPLERFVTNSRLRLQYLGSFE